MGKKRSFTYMHLPHASTDADVLERRQRIADGTQFSEFEVVIAEVVSRYVNSAGRSVNKQEVQELLDTFKGMTLLELSEFVKDFEHAFNVTAQHAAVSTEQIQQFNQVLEVEEEPEEWTVTITGIGDKKIQVIKEIRSITKLGLAESKAFAENLPNPVVENVDKMRAVEVKAALEKAGAAVTMVPSG